MKKKIICFIIPSLYAGGGSERVITELANYCANNTSVETHLLILAKTEKFYLVSKNVIIHEPNFDYKKYSRIAFTVKIMHYLRKEIVRIKPDAVLSFEEMYSSFVLLSTLFLKYPIFISDRSKPNKNWGPFHNTLRKILYRFASGIVSQTVFSKNFLFRETRNNNIRVISNPIKIIKSGNPIDKRQNLILNVGRLIKSKNQDLLIDLFSNGNFKDWKLVIIGDGPELDNLVNKSKILNLQDKIEFTGNISNVDAYYLRSKIFAFTSTSEGFPNALGEAMSAGLACISFDCIAGPSDLIDDGVNGFLIKENDTELYLETLKKLVSNEKLCNEVGKKASHKMENFSINNIGPNYINFLLK